MSAPVTPGQAAREVAKLTGVHAGTVSWDELPDSYRRDWEAVAQAGVAAVVNPTAEDYDNAAEILELRHERDEAREALDAERAALEVSRATVAAIREQLAATAEYYELSAQATYPSRKSQIEQECAKAMREIAETVPGADPAAAARDDREAERNDAREDPF